jgi:hypothetical protein
MLDGCNDTGRQDPLPPLRNQAVRWAQNGHSTVLARVDADRAGRASVTLTVPLTATPGPATVQLGIARRAAVAVVSTRQEGSQ